MSLLKRINISINEYDDDETLVASSMSLADYVLEGGFPSSFNESLKGSGYFNFQVRKFSFSVLWGRFRETHPSFSVIPKRKTQIIFSVLNEQGSIESVLVDSFVDEVQLQGNPEEEEYKLTIYPNALLLKDTNIGSVIDEEDEEDQNYLFETRDSDSEPLTTWKLKDIVQKALDYVNERVKNVTFSVTDESVPDGDPPTTNKKFGNILYNKDLVGFGLQIWLLIRAAFSGTGAKEYAKDMSYFVRKENTSDGEGDYYIEEKSRLGNYVWLSQGQWINWSKGALLSIHLSKYWSKWGWTWGFNLGSWYLPNDDFYVPTGDNYVPWFETRKEVYELKGGGMNHIDTLQWWWHEGETSHSQYGTKYYSDTSSVISKNSTKLNTFLKEKGYDQKDWNQTNFSSFDHDESNSYAVFTMTPEALISKNGVDVFGRQIVVSFEGCFDDSYRLEVKNWTMTKLLNNLAKVSNRYMYVDETNTIHLLPRSTDLNAPDNFTVGSVYYDKNDILKYAQKFVNEDEYDMNVDRLEYRTDGSVTNYGIWLRDAEYQGMQKFYSDYFSRDKVEYKITLTSNSDKLDDTKLLKKLYINDGIEDKYYGHIIDVQRNFIENQITLTTEAYNDV